MRSYHLNKLTLSRIFAVVAFVGILSVAANAYTVILRGGRQVEIPSQFVLTASTLTYEVSPGVQVTINVAAIDIAATENANHEVSGSLLRRIQATSAPRASAEPPAARRTITNLDLQASMKRRLDSETTYERRRKELGLPTLEESRRQAAAEAESIGKDLQETRIAERESESYWRERAAALRTEIAVVDAELSYVRRQVEEPFYAGISGSYTNLGGVPLVSFGGVSRGPFPQRVMRPQVFGAPGGSAQVIGRIPFGGGATQGQVLVNPGRFPRARSFGSQLVAPVAVLGSGYDYTYERSVLITRFNELSAARTGLNARWRELEDEARRAGAPPGWLRR
ncbi:MAG TPA: hypothetical protein VGO56_14500 [Pyrinomonadaceae bacterium]|jgi:hypothetical protein|nr:hypothetical protein [Pyrinomonadaceae bacterium]